MKYMNKQLAEQTAENMLKSAQAKIYEKVMRQRIYAGGIALKNLPTTEEDQIFKLVELGWIKESKGFYFRNPLSSDNYSFKYFITETDIPEKADDKYIYPTVEEWEKLIAFENEIKQMKDKKKALEQQIISTLLRLRTYERIQKDFPEAFACLPKDMLATKNEISLPIENILADISKFPG